MPSQSVPDLAAVVFLPVHLVTWSSELSLGGNSSSGDDLLPGHGRSVTHQEQFTSDLERLLQTLHYGLCSVLVVEEVDEAVGLRGELATPAPVVVRSAVCRVEAC